MNGPSPYHEHQCTALAKLAVEFAIAELMVSRAGDANTVQQEMFESLINGVLAETATAGFSNGQKQLVAGAIVFQSAPAAIWTNSDCVMPVIVGLAETIARDLDLMREEGPMFRFEIGDGEGLFNGLTLKKTSMRCHDEDLDAVALVFSKIVTHATFASIHSREQAAIGYANACRLAGKPKASVPISG